MENLLEYRMDWEWDMEQERRRREEEELHALVYRKKEDWRIVTIFTLYPSRLRVFDCDTHDSFEIEFKEEKTLLTIFKNFGLSYYDFELKNK